jgi:hypothetical protein
LRLPGFANKKYETDFYVEARRESTESYLLRDFKLHIDSQNSPRHTYDNRAKRELSPRITLSQSEADWAYAKSALARGDDPQEVMRRIADYRSEDKADPNYYARLTVTKAQAQLSDAKPLSQTAVFPANAQADAERSS